MTCFCLDIIDPHFFFKSNNFVFSQILSTLKQFTSDPLIGGLWNPKEMPSFEPQQGKEVIQVNEDCLEKLEPLGSENPFYPFF